MRRMSELELVSVSCADRVHSVSETWHGGQVIGLVGPNGAGKSTLLRLAAGVWRPTSGQVRLDGRRIDGWPAKERARELAYLPQQGPDDTPYTVREYVEMGRYAHERGLKGLDATGRERVDAAIRRLDLHGLVNAPLADISGGERQRAGLARCLAQGSPVLLLDEPTSNLDLYYQLDILQHLQGLAQEGYLIVLAIHHLELAAQYCHRMVLLNAGQLVAAGSPREVLTEATLEAVFRVSVKTYTDPFGHALRLSFG